MRAPLLTGHGPGTELPAGPGAVPLARAHWPTGPGDELAQLPGFVVSSFSPAVAQAAQRCLSDFFGPPPAPAALGERTGVVIASVTGDIATAAAVAAAVDAGRRVPPLLFFQSNPNAVAGFLTARWGLAGPVVCTCPGGDARTDARRSAALLIASGEADAVLVITVSQAGVGAVRGRAQCGGGRGARGREQQSAGAGTAERGGGESRASVPGAQDHAEAELIGPPHWAATANRTEQGGST